MQKNARFFIHLYPVNTVDNADKCLLIPFLEILQLLKINFCKKDKENQLLFFLRFSIGFFALCKSKGFYGWLIRRVRFYCLVINIGISLIAN